MKLLLILIIVSITLPTVYAKDTKKNMFSPSLPLLADQLANKKLKKLTGVSVSLVDRSGILWSHNAGMASKRKKKVLSDDTAMRMASVSKVFTALGVMQLAEQGKIDIDRPYTDYVPEFSIKSHSETKEITIRHLLTHRSGLPKDFFKGIHEKNGSQELNYRSLPQSLSNTFLTDPAGERFSYSNLGFALLGILIERVSKEDFVEYINHHILDPLNMNNSSFLPDDRIKGKIANGHLKTGEIDYEYMRDLSAGALNASGADMAYFMICLLNDGRSIVKPETFKTMLKQREYSPIDGSVKMGLGFFIDKFDDQLQGVKTISHSGDLAGHHTTMILLPDHGLGISAMTNDEKGFDAIRDFALELLSEAYRLKTGHTPEKKEMPAKISLTRTQKDRLSGLYVTSYDENSLWEIFTDKKGQLKVKSGDDKFDLIAYEDDTFRIQSFLLNILTFTGLIDDEIKRFSLKLRLIENRPYFYEFSAGVFLSPVAAVPIPETWKQSIGKYCVQNAEDHDAIMPGTIVEVGLDKAKGLLLVNGLPVKPVSNQYAIIMGKSSHLGETVQRMEDGSLYSSGFIYKKL